MKTISGNEEQGSQPFNGSSHEIPALNAAEKPPMPDDAPTTMLSGTVKLKLLHDFDRYSTGSMVMRIADTNIEVKEGDKTIGSMGSAMGGQMYVQHGQRLWAIDKQSLWDAVLTAEKEYLQS